MLDLLAALVLAAPAAPAPVLAAPAPVAAAAVDPKRGRRTHDELEAWVGHAPPPFSASMTWYGTDAMTWDDLRGRVVLLQSWDHGSVGGRAWLDRAARLREMADVGDDLVVVAVHTPEDADEVAAFLENKQPDLPVVVDRDGAFLDALGIFRRPMSVLVGRRGAVRHVALGARDTVSAIRALCEEKADPDAPKPEPLEQASPAPARAEFPPIVGTVKNARDVRGATMPDLVVEQWINGRPDFGGVVMVDFWATWCGPCVASIPHVNELADRFREDVTVVGLSNEPADKFAAGLQKRNLRTETFRYALGLDPKARTKNALQVRGIPHAVVISSDGIVRWQGHPATLQSSTVQAIVDADRALRGVSNQGRWAAWLADR